MKHMVTSVGEKLTAKEFEEFLNEVELNSDGSISTNSEETFSHSSKALTNASVYLSSNRCGGHFGSLRLTGPTPSFGVLFVFFEKEYKESVLDQPRLQCLV